MNDAMTRHRANWRFGRSIAYPHGKSDGNRPDSRYARMPSFSASCKMMTASENRVQIEATLTVDVS
jgi:hypothetical protein